MTERLTVFIRESNWIEGLRHEPTAAEIAAHVRFLTAPEITVEVLEDFVATVQPGARLRDQRGLNVMVGRHIAPLGGAHIVHKLRHILRQARMRDASPFHIHRAYLTLHPFTDGNGRSARVLWLWMNGGEENLHRCFLHQFYYDTLAAGDQL